MSRSPISAPYATPVVLSLVVPTDAAVPEAASTEVPLQATNRSVNDWKMLTRKGRNREQVLQGNGTDAAKRLQAAKELASRYISPEGREVVHGPAGGDEQSFRSKMEWELFCQGKCSGYRTG